MVLLYLVSGILNTYECTLPSIGDYIHITIFVIIILDLKIIFKLEKINIYKIVPKII